ncbi:MAG: hypothetical protein ABIV42_05745 [Nitrosospira sp.]
MRKKKFPKDLSGIEVGFLNEQKVNDFAIELSRHAIRAGGGWLLVGMA